MKLRYFTLVLVWAASAANAVAAALFFYLSWFLIFGTVDGAELSGPIWLFIALSLLFMIGGLYLIRQTWRTFITAKGYRASDEYKRLEVASSKAVPYVPRKYQISPETRVYIHDKLSILEKHEVLSPSDLNRMDLDEILSIENWEADYYGLLSLLIHADSTLTGGFSNLLGHVQQEECFEEYYAELIERLAIMLELADNPENIGIAYGEEKRVLSFMLAGDTHEFEGGVHAKYVDWDVLARVANVLERRSDDRRIYTSGMDMSFVLTTLKPETCDALNIALSDTATPDYEPFVRVSEI